MSRWTAQGVVIGLCLAGCGPELEPSSVLPSPEAQPTSSQQMAERLRLISDNAKVDRDPFLNRRRAELLERRLPTPQDPNWARASFELANELLRAGRSAEAVERMEALAVEIPEFGQQLLYQRAVAWLRLGEQENCLQDHNADSCLWPLPEGGVHRRADSARRARDLLLELLEREPDRLDARWLLNLAAMAIGELKGQPFKSIPEPLRWPESAFQSQAEIPRFHDVAAGLGLGVVGLAGGTVVEDLDGDGDLDVMASSWGARDPLRLLLNDQGQFVDVSAQAGLPGLDGGLNLLHADFDNDGAVDVLVLRGAWRVDGGRRPNSLLRNLGPGHDGIPRFADVTEAAGLLSFHPTQTAAWADFDLDGDLDLFIGNESLPGRQHYCELFRNSGPSVEEAGDGSTFTDVAASLGLAIDGYVKGVVWGDVDNDGWPDLYVSRLMQPNLLFHNQSGQGFVEIASQAGVSEPVHSFPTWFFDVDNDGWLDIFVAGYAADYFDPVIAEVARGYLGEPVTEALPRLYRNLGGQGGGEIRFEDVTEAYGLRHPLYAMGSNFGDLDTDGWLDIYLGTGAPGFDALVPNRMFINDAGTGFLDVTVAGGFGHLQKGHGVAFADLDNDGDEDVYTVLGGAFEGDTFANALFLNPGHSRQWVNLRLQGTTSHRSAVGARLRLEVEGTKGARQIYRTVGSGGSFGAQSLRQAVGLGSATEIRAVEVTWPGGRKERFQGVAPNRFWLLTEGSGSAVPLQAPRFDFTSIEHPGHGDPSEH